METKRIEALIWAIHNVNNDSIAALKDAVGEGGFANLTCAEVWLIGHDRFTGEYREDRALGLSVEGGTLMVWTDGGKETSGESLSESAIRKGYEPVEQLADVTGRYGGWTLTANIESLLKGVRDAAYLSR